MSPAGQDPFSPGDEKTQKNAARDLGGPTVGIGASTSVHFSTLRVPDCTCTCTYFYLYVNIQLLTRAVVFGKILQPPSVFASVLKGWQHYVPGHPGMGFPYKFYIKFCFDQYSKYNAVFVT